MPQLTPRHLALALGLCFGMAAAPALATTTPAAFTAQVAHGSLTLAHGKDRIAIGFITPTAVRIHVLPDGESSPASIVINPKALHAAPADVKTRTTGTVTTLSTLSQR